MTKPDQILTDVMDPARAHALLATLGLEASLIADDVLPPFFHHVYFWDPLPPSQLGRDGHPALGGFVPDTGLPRRMWAAGQLNFYAPLRVGRPAQKRSAVESVTKKTGRSGPLAFVRVRHDISQGETLALTEWQDLVYREDKTGQATAPLARTDETHRETVDFDSTSLFRYSALTFNGHRIHFDQTYTREVEGYEDLVTHGPLLAQHLMLMGQRMLGRPLTEVSYRATAPLTLPYSAELCWAAGTAWVRGPDGRQCMVAEIR